MSRRLIGVTLLLSRYGFAASKNEGHRHVSKVKLRRETLSMDVDDQAAFSLALVVVRCNETLDWLSSFWHVVPENFRLNRVHVIEKCAGATSCRKAAEIGKIDKAFQVEASAKIRSSTGNVPMIPRVDVTCQKNVGMGLYGYVHHIVENYNSLEDYTFFSAAAYDKSFDLCDVPQFLDLAQRRGFAGVGFQYTEGKTLGRWDPLPSCRGSGLAMKFGTAGATLGVSGNNFIASRGAIRHSKKGTYSKLTRCFHGLKPRRRPVGIEEDQWRLMVPGRMENTYWEEAGHMFFGMPRRIPKQDVIPCKGNWTTEALDNAEVPKAEVAQSVMEESARTVPPVRSRDHLHFGQYAVLGVLGYCFYSQVSSLIALASMAI